MQKIMYELAVKCNDASSLKEMDCLLLSLINSNVMLIFFCPFVTVLTNDLAIKM